MKLNLPVAGLGRIQHGQSLFELVVAIGISALVIVSLVSLATTSMSSSTFARRKSQASVYAQEATEWFRSERDRDIANFLAQVPVVDAPYTFCLTDLSWRLGNCSNLPDDYIPDTTFTRKAILTRRSLAGGKLVVDVEVDVSWQDNLGHHIVNNSTEFSDWSQR